MNPKQEEIYVNVRDDNPVVIEVKGHKFEMHWLKRGQWKKMVELTCKSGNDTMSLCKWFAMRLCNTFWKMKIYYPLLWRYLYYFLRIKESDRHYLADVAFKMMRLPKELRGDAIIEDEAYDRLPWLFLPKKFLFGLITVSNWDLNWGFTQAQIDLLLLDKPLNLYKK